MVGHALEEVQGLIELGIGVLPAAALVHPFLLRAAHRVGGVGADAFLGQAGLLPEGVELRAGYDEWRLSRAVLAGAAGQDEEVAPAPR